MAETLRAFIAVELNEEIKKTIIQVEDDLKITGCDVKWVKPENAHLTIKFLGQIKEKRLGPLLDALDSLFIELPLNKLNKDIHPIQTGLTQAGAFPSLQRPRVIWIGLRDDARQISRLAESVEEALGGIGFKKEDRPFQPHITIGRFRSTHNLFSFTKKFEQYSLPAAPDLTISSITLFKSTLTSSGPIYESLKKFSFS
jgi:2'-5' RNA ligase